MPPHLFGSIAWYAVFTAHSAAAIDYNMRYDKRRKHTHRYRIADTRGPLELTVPVSRPAGFSRGTLLWSDISVSAHGRWWEIHRTALESAYGRTPFFEFYIDRLAPLFEPRPVAGETAMTLCRDAHIAVMRILDLETENISVERALELGADDLRQTPIETPDVPYWQVRAQSLGFIGRLSILDAIFNLGPETPLLLHEIIAKYQ